MKYFVETKILRPDRWGEMEYDGPLSKLLTELNDFQRDHINTQYLIDTDGIHLYGEQEYFGEVER